MGIDTRMFLRTRTSLILLLVAAATLTPAPAAEQGAHGGRPPIGLVLSGGGARGGAHVGVLKVLEELRVPVDYIAGTSSGALIGGLYSSGLSPQEIENALGLVDWANVLEDTRARERLSFRRKEDDNLALFPLEVGVGKNGFSNPPGIAAGENIEFVLRVLTAHTAGERRFDKLRIPFRAVATDLDSGEAVVLDRGDLTEAMRASMSIPGVFTPVERDGRVLVDGGVANNLPVDVARTMGARRIIAVNVGTPPKGARGLSALGVVGQTLNVLTEERVTARIASLTPHDLLITPDLGDISSGQFERNVEAIGAGEVAARQAEAELRKFSVSEKEFSAYLQRQRLGAQGARPEVVVDSVEVHGLDDIATGAVLPTLRTKPGEPLNGRALRKDLDRVHRLGEFEQVGFELTPAGEDSRLAIKAKPKSWGPGYLRFGLALETGFDGSSDFRALVHYRRPSVNRLGAEWRNLATGGETTGLSSEFFQPLHARRLWFVAPRATWQRTQDRVFLPDGAQEVFEATEFVAQLDFGVQISNIAEFRVGARRGYLNADPRTETLFEFDKVDLGGWSLQATVDTLDNPFFPTHGNLTRADLFFSRRGMGATDTYDKALLSLTQAGHAGRNTVFAQLDLGSDFGTGLPIYDALELGGFLNLSGLQAGELRGNVLGLATLGYFWRAFRMGQVGDIYVGAAAQAGNVWQDVSEAELGDLRYSGTLFVGADTAFVPVYLGFGVADEGDNAFYLFVGQVF